MGPAAMASRERGRGSNAVATSPSAARGGERGGKQCGPIDGRNAFRRPCRRAAPRCRCRRKPVQPRPGGRECVVDVVRRGAHTPGNVTQDEPLGRPRGCPPLPGRESPRQRMRENGHRVRRALGRGAPGRIEPAMIGSPPGSVGAVDGFEELGGSLPRNSVSAAEGGQTLAAPPAAHRIEQALDVGRNCQGAFGGRFAM